MKTEQVNQVNQGAYRSSQIVETTEQRIDRLEQRIREQDGCICRMKWAVWLAVFCYSSALWCFWFVYKG